MNFKLFSDFVHERERVRLLKESGEPQPWTKDPVLQEYRFCNVHREDDRVTRWIAKNWRDPHRKDEHVWFAMVVARLINWPATLGAIPYPYEWEKTRVRTLNTMDSMVNAGEQVFTGAYMINQSIPGGKGLAKHRYLAEFVLDPLWDKRHLFTKDRHHTLQSFHATLQGFKGMGSFMAGQVVADTKYTNTLSTAKDWHTWAASGPGSRRGLARLCELPITFNWKEDAWFLHMTELRNDFNLRRNHKLFPEPLHAQDIQNCLCEVDKYLRGSSRSRYQPTQEE